MFPAKDTSSDAIKATSKAQFTDLKHNGGCALNAMTSPHADYFVSCKYSANDSKFIVIGEYQPISIFL